MTRYPLDASTHLKWRPATYYAGSALFALAFAVYGSFLHDSVVTVWAISLAALVVGAALNVLMPAQLRLPFIVAFLLVGGGVNAREGDFVLPGLWIIFLGLGVILTQEPLRRRARARRDALAEGAPPAQRDPRKLIDMGNMMVWVDGRWMYEAVDPTREQVLDTVRALNGGDLSSIVLFHGSASLSVGGNSAGPLAVVHIPDRNRGHTFALVDADAAASGREAYTDPGKIKIGPRITVEIAGEKTEIHPGLVTDDLDAVVRAVNHFLTTGQRLPEATWYEGTRNSPVSRPGVWTVFDTRA